jgi:CDGSH-type Zn-finger protein
MTNPRVYVNPKSGSIKITGTVDIVDSEGNVIKTTDNVKFCGCKLTKDYPYCDGSHKAITGGPEKPKEN